MQPSLDQIHYFLLNYICAIEKNKACLYVKLMLTGSIFSSLTLTKGSIHSMLWQAFGLGDD